MVRAVAGVNPFAGKRGDDLLYEKVHRPAPRLSTGRRDATAKAFEDIVARALAFAPTDRFASAADLRLALERLPVQTAHPAHDPIELHVDLVEPLSRAATRRWHDACAVPRQ